MSDLENRLRRLEAQLVVVPSAEAYLDASHRQQVRGLAVLAKLLEKHGFDGDYLFVEANRRMLAEDTPEKQGRDRKIVEAWYRSKGRDRASEVEGAREKLLAKLEARSGK